MSPQHGVICLQSFIREKNQVFDTRVYFGEESGIVDRF